MLIRRSIAHTRRVVSILAVAGAAAGCSAFSPTGPNTLTPSAGGVFSGTVYPDGRTRWPFALEAAGTVTLTLTSVEPSSLVVGLGFGTLTHKGCNATTAVEAQVGNAAPQLKVTADAGQKCVEVFDVGGVPESGAPFTVSLQSF
jgi:hypothetical protein